MKLTFWISLVVFLLSFLAVAISALLPLVSGGKTSWEEALYGIIPGSLCSCVSFLCLTALAIIMMVTKQKAPSEPGRKRDAESSRRRSRAKREEDEDEEEDDEDE